MGVVLNDYISEAHKNPANVKRRSPPCQYCIARNVCDKLKCVTWRVNKLRKIKIPVINFMS